MATQKVTGIPFSSTHTQQTFKLLELPNELLALLESENPPTLRLETCPTTSHALLTVPSSTLKYRIQQKNSSNPLHILAPSSTSHTSLLAESPTSNEIKLAEDGDKPSVTAIAKIEDTLELLPVKNGDEAPEKKVNKWHEKFAKSRMGKK